MATPVTLRRSMLLVLAACLLGTLVPLSPFGPGTRTAGAWSEGPCPTSAGVTVVVDFQELGGGIWVRCTDVAVTTGFEAFDRAGIPWAATVRAAGFLCRIDGKPANDPCQAVSPARAYWSHWMAPRGGSWCYSNLGGGTRRPPEGTVDAWSFSYERTASSPPTPRYAPPAWVPGAPTTLLANDCDPSTTAPTVPTVPTVPRPTGDGWPNAPGAGGAVRPGATASGPSTGPAAGTPAAPSASGATASTSPTNPAAAATTSPGIDAPATTPDDGTSAASGSGSEGATTPSTIVDADGEEVAINGESAERATPVPTSSPVGAAVALVIIGALTATSVVVRRRVTAAP